MMFKKFDKNKFAFALILIGYCIYAGLYIYKTSFVIDGKRYFCLFDDAMISMRYAKNMAHGYGLVWNPSGERVEGYTNLFWVLYMSLFHLLPVAQSKICLFIQISGALFLILNLFFVKKIADLISNGSAAVALSSVFLTAFYLSLNSYGLQGMEVSVLTLIISAFIYKTLQCLKSNKFSIWLYLLLGLAIFIRNDIIVPYLTFFIFGLIADSKNRRENFIWGLFVLIFVVFAQTLFRIWYYHDILPNTYYLKMTGYPFFARISRGFHVFLEFVSKLNWVLFVLPFFLFLFRRNKELILLFSLFLMQIIYSIFVGGDVWESWAGANRFLSVAMPAFFILFSLSVFEILLNLYRMYEVEKKTKQIERYAKYTMLIFVFISSFNINATYGEDAWSEWLLIKPPRLFLNKEMVKIGLLLTQITKKEAKIAVATAGASPYFSNRYSIDLLGKNDKKIAREKMRVPHGLQKFFLFFPGHLKLNYAYSIGQLKPDVVAQLLFLPGEAKKYLNTDYTKVELKGFSLYFLNGSDKILWDSIKSAE